MISFLKSKRPTLLIILSIALVQVLAGTSLDDLFPSVSQEVFPLNEFGIREPKSLGRLPDGRVFILTDLGEVFLFDGENWNLLSKRLPKGTSKSFLDSKGTLWIGGQGFFGKLDHDLNYHELSDSKFSGHLDNSLSILWMYETGDWIHFSSNKTIYHYNRATERCEATRFEGMFDAYHWMWDGKLYLGTKEDIQVWEGDRFVKLMDWSHKYRAFVGWEHEGKSYFLNAINLFVYEDGKLVETINDNQLMKMRGAFHLMCEDHLLIFTLGGIVKMHRDGKCEGFYTPWFHQKITRANAFEPFYRGGDEVWFLTDAAIFRVNLNAAVKEISVQNGYPLTGAWDMENFKGNIYTSSIQGLERWVPQEHRFEFPHQQAPDFETTDIWQAFGKLFVSTWVELGIFDESYEIKHSDGFYQVFARADQPDCFWVAMDKGVRLMNREFEILKEIPLHTEVTSLVENHGKLWITTLEAHLMSIDTQGDYPFCEYTNLLKLHTTAPIHHLEVFEKDDRLFVVTESSVLEWKNDQFDPLPIPIQEGWRWEIPRYSSQRDTIMLMQRHQELSGCKIGEFLIPAKNKAPAWHPTLVSLESAGASIRRLKRLEGIDGNVAVVITQSSIELIDLDNHPNEADPIQLPAIVKSVHHIGDDITCECDGVYVVKPGRPLRVAIHSEQNRLGSPIRYYGRLKGQKSWMRNATGNFEFYGILRGSREFEGFAEDAFGNRSGLVHHKIKVVPQWYLQNIFILIYLLLLILFMLTAVHIQTHRLKKRAKLLEQKIDERTQDLIQANRAKSIFVSNVSHEIRNPLNGLLGLAQNLKVGDQIDDSTLQRLRRPSLYLYRFLSNVLDFSKFESGGIRFNERVFDPHELLDSVEAMFSGDFKERQITFIADYRFDHTPFIISSQEAIEMILVNLVGNALKYTPENGNIRLAILKKNSQLRLSVADTGIGISANDIERIFDAYQQGEQSPLISGEKGAGIGLSLVRHTTHQLQGSIKVESLEGNGSTFFVNFPIQEPTQDKKPEMIDKVFLTGRYLIVEDLEYNLKLFADLLKTWGAVVEEATDGTTAIERAQSNHYDMIFLDYDLPDMTGVDVTLKLKEKSQNLTTPIVGLSAYTDQEFIQKGLRSGMADYLFKPLNASKLAECMLRVIPDNISYTTLSDDASASFRSSLFRIQRSSGGPDEEIDQQTQEYLQTLDSLVETLKLSDIGSKAFESIAHKLKGHSSFINHHSSVHFWDQMIKLSKEGNRMKLLDDMDTVSKIVGSIKREVYGLVALEQDYQHLNPGSDQVSSVD